MIYCLVSRGIEVDAGFYRNPNRRTISSGFYQRQDHNARAHDHVADRKNQSPHFKILALIAEIDRGAIPVKETQHRSSCIV